MILGFEQATKYTVYDHAGEVVALMAEQRTGIANELGRQLLRTHRSFTTTVFTADGVRLGVLRGGGKGWAGGQGGGVYASHCTVRAIGQCCTTPSAHPQQLPACNSRTLRC